jgi:tripartite-type tricarboxylate transporter receptor subunit TctC
MFKKLTTLLLAYAVIFSAHADVVAAPRTVTATVGYAPGSGNETSFRGVAAIVEKTNPGVNFIVQNKPGADEVVALNWFMKQPGDGSNIYITSQQGVFTTIEQWYPNQIQFNPMDMQLVTTIAKSPLAVIANVNSKTNTPQELVARLRNTKEPVTFGLGAGAHKLVFEYLMDKGRGNHDQVKAVMYRGPMQAAQDVAGNQVEFGIMPTAVAYGLYKAGKIKYIALASEFKLAQLPDVPLWKDSGMPGLNIYGAWMIALPPGTPKETVKYYQNLFVPAINSADAKRFFDENLMFPVPAEQSPEGARKFINGIRETWIPYVKKMKLD